MVRGVEAVLKAPFADHKETRPGLQMTRVGWEGRSVVVHSRDIKGSSILFIEGEIKGSGRRVARTLPG